jgi:hypothetical protein
MFDRVSLKHLVIALLALAASAGPAGEALAQAYTYDEPKCGAAYREEAAKPQQLRVVWEMSAANLCIQESRVSVACKHLQAALAASDRMEADAGSPDGIKAQLKTMLGTNGCP